MYLKKIIGLMILLGALTAFGGVAHAQNVMTAPGQWVLTAAADLASAGTDIRIQSIVWFPAAADNDLLLTNAAETVIIVKARAMCAATNGETFCVEIWTAADLPAGIKGLDLVLIDGGVLYINFESRRR